MTLRLKITLLLSAVILVSVFANFAIQQVAVAPSFRSLEHDLAIEDWHRCEKAIMRDHEALSSLCFDWGSWDDAYLFVQDKNPAFFDANLKNPGWFSDQQIDVLYFCRPDGSVYWKRIADKDTGEPTTLAFMPGDRLPPNHPLLSVTASKESKVDGLVYTELGFVMMSARPILTSKNEGPLAGVLIFGRRLNDAAVEALRQQTGVEFTVHNTSGEDLSEQQRAGISTSIKSDAPVEELVDSEHLVVRGVLRDLNSQPVMLIQTAGVRNISNYGHAALKFANASLLASGGVTLIVLLLALGWLIIDPLSALTRHAAHVGDSGQMRERLELHRRDELGTLATAFNRMLQQLDEFRVNSVMMSRQAGMAEVAAGVLHNVGNAMTNVGVLADSMAGSLARSKASGLARVSALLNEHKADLPAFFGEGREGRHLPVYIEQLAAQINSEVADLQRDLSGLHEGLQHVKTIVASHQQLATTPSFSEITEVGDVVAMAVTLVEASYRRHGVELKVESSPSDPVSCDRAKLSQVLVNLLTNAKEALVSAPTPGPRVLVRFGPGDDGTAFIEISDNGPGVDRKNTDRLFSKGFSTKADGHGVGLHYCWLAVREMNGMLSFVGGTRPHGATFRIELPRLVGAQKAAA